MPEPEKERASPPAPFPQTWGSGDSAPDDPLAELSKPVSRRTGDLGASAATGQPHSPTPETDGERTRFEAGPDSSKRETRQEHDE